MDNTNTNTEATACECGREVGYYEATFCGARCIHCAALAKRRRSPKGRALIRLDAALDAHRRICEATGRTNALAEGAWYRGSFLVVYGMDMKTTRIVERCVDELIRDLGLSPNFDKV